MKTFDEVFNEFANDHDRANALCSEFKETFDNEVYKRFIIEISTYLLQETCKDHTAVRLMAKCAATHDRIFKAGMIVGMRMNQIDLSEIENAT